MKKKLLTLLLVCAMALATSLVAFAGKDVTGREAVTADPAKVLVIDVRTTTNFNNGEGSLKGAENWPLFDTKGLSTEANGNLYLAEAFKTEALERKTELADKEIYILCNSGASGAKLATEILTSSEVGYNADKVHTITHGAKGLEVKYGILNRTGSLNNMTVEPSKAEKDLADGTAIVIDVRTATNNNKASLAGSIHVPVFDEKTGVAQRIDAPLADAFMKYAEDNKTTLSQKPIYLLCNSGQSGARAATVLLAEKGLTNVYTIKGGAAAIENIEFRYGMLDAKNTVSAADAVASIGNSKVVVLDVRNNANYDKGYVEGSLHIPVFKEPADGGKTPATITEPFAQEFIDKVKAAENQLKDKSIYILCNSGKSGAKAATVLLTKAGYDLKNIYTITGGAGAVDSSLKTTYRYVDGATAIKAAKEGSAYVIDVRSNAARKNVNLDHLSDTNVIYLQLFDEGNSLKGADAEKLAEKFTKYVTDNKSALEQKPIYILCNSGASGARRATELLGLAGYDITASQGTVYTIKHGAKGIDVYYSYLEAAGKLQKPVEGKDAVAAVGNNKILILNVRATGNYGAGHLKGAFSLPVFSSSGVVKSTGDSLAQAFTTYVKENKAWFDAFDEIYVMCNSGASGAKAATVLLNDAKVDAIIRTVTGGAKGTDTDKSVPNASTYVSAEYVLSTFNKDGYLVLDVRSASKYAAGHLKGSLSLPLFDNNNKIDTDDAKALAEKFTAYVKENKAALEGKTIYILCNSGNSGANKAVTLLKELGITANVFTIDGGATTIVKDYFVTDKPSKPSSPQTGDSSTVMLYAFAMAAAVIVIARRRELTK